ncbi:MAG: hypothetical protein HOP30_21740 [Cyclobacteriaceae bacterium]|nr:hypothetical protein [Cyclobacteriaceae bacterium]
MDRKVVVEKIAQTYTAEIGVRELTGRNDGARVEEYLAVTGFKKGNAWCAAFIAWSLERTSSDLHVLIKHPKSAWAPSWFPPAKTIYVKADKYRNVKPDRADVFGIYYAKDNRIGHVGFIDQWPPNQDYAITVEGNTNTAGSREGDGVYRKRRLKQNIYKVSRWV